MNTWERITETPIVQGRTKLGVSFTIRKLSDGRVGWSAAGHGWSAAGSGGNRQEADAQLARAIAAEGMP